MKGDRKQISRPKKTAKKFSARPEEVVYDADDHREFVTGFKRRKDERRRRAEDELAEQARKDRLEKRKEKRQLLKKLREARGMHGNETFTWTIVAALDAKTVYNISRIPKADLQNLRYCTTAAEFSDDDIRSEEGSREKDNLATDERMYTNHEGGKVRVTVEQMQSSIAPRVPMGKGRAQKMESELKPKSEGHWRRKGDKLQREGDEV
eukprot:CAMPEP_0184742534 /NCGR_PEP_ID=MMETSP0315-20130426/5475_1 /TAXON_ID=101924 /ORGANISM="Rhodosorus marinus, Strain UTEX LB 2760" /LENGTH=207 /DNA_ID=CAMNT_0027213391 /DNA_START=110 /DNA_END=735 /DNA_ORIENTATION=-